MSLLDEARAVPLRAPPRCPVLDVPVTLADDVADLVAAVRNGQVRATKALEVLNNHGIPLTKHYFKAHLDGSCSCP